MHRELVAPSGEGLLLVVLHLVKCTGAVRATGTADPAHTPITVSLADSFLVLSSLWFSRLLLLAGTVGTHRLRIWPVLLSPASMRPA